MITHTQVYDELKEVTQQLIALGLSESQNFPMMKKTGPDAYEISYSGSEDLSIVLKNVAYGQIYKELASSKNYNTKLIDGALVQMMYVFHRGLIGHRLAFFPSPALEDFQNNPEIYEQDEIYADILAKNLIPFPLRFDFEPSKHIEVEHPKCHLTLGQFKNCRIPVAFPLTPFVFISFVLRHFYNTAFRKFTDELALPFTIAEETITTEEKKILHMTFC
jgi:hypothetical protein